MLTPSPSMETFVKLIEGFRAASYPDPKTGGDPWTIGYGSTSVKGKRVQHGQHISIEDAATEVTVRLKRLGELLYERLPTAVAAELTQGRIDALVSILDNVGPGVPGVRSGIVRLRTGQYSTLWLRLLDANWDRARDELMKWVSPGSSVEAGLRKRRRAETLIWGGADPVTCYYEIFGKQ